MKDNAPLDDSDCLRCVKYRIVSDGGNYGNALGTDVTDVAQTSQMTTGVRPEMGIERRFLSFWG
jgi:hypothetical protein